MKRIVCICILLIILKEAYAQEVEIKGRITDAQTGEPLPGATILIKGSKNSTSADKEGYYQFQNLTGSNFTLVISFVGYQTFELTVTVSKNNMIAANAALRVDDKPGNEVVVSASRRPEKITDAPASIQIIGKKELEQFTGSNTFELLSKVQGVEFIRTGIDAVSFNARGMNNAFNNKVFQLVDGRNSMAVHSGNLMMHNNSSMVKEDIERIEIVLGPQTALYGPNVHNALINIITKDPRQSQGTIVALSGGNQYQFSGRFRHAAKINNKWAYKLSGEYATGRDFEFYDSVYAGNQSGGTPFFGQPVTIPERKINFNFRRIRAEAQAYYNLTSKSNIIVSTGGINTNSIGIHTGGHLQLRGVTYHFLQGRFVHPRLFINLYHSWADFGSSFNIGPYTMDYWNRTHSTITDPNHPQYKTIGRLSPDSAEINAMRYGIRVKEKPQRFNAEAQYNYKFEKAGLFLISGFSYQSDMPRAFGITLVDSFQKINITQAGAVVQLEKALPLDLRLVGAARWDYHSNFGNFFSPKIGFIKRMGAGNIRLTWARAYSMPSVLFQYANTVGLFFGNGKGITYIPNKTKMSDNIRVTTSPLKPEEVNTWELGYKGNLLNKLYIDVNYFNGLSKNFFNPSTTIGGLALYVGDQRVTQNPAFAGRVGADDTLRNASFTTVTNFGDVRVYGIDAGLTYSINKFVNLALKYSWIGSDIKKGKAANDSNKDGYVAADEKSLNSAPNRITLILGFQNLFNQKFVATIAARYVEQYDFYSGNQISTSAGEGKRGVVKGPNGINYIKNFDWGPLGGFTSIDLNAGYQFNQRMSAGINITNFFNTKQREFAGSPLIGRLFMIELKVQVPNSK